MMAVNTEATGAMVWEHGSVILETIAKTQFSYRHWAVALGYQGPLIMASSSTHLGVTSLKYQGQPQTGPLSEAGSQEHAFKACLLP